MERAVNFQKQSLDKIEVKLKEFDDRSIIGVLKRFFVMANFLLWKESDLTVGQYNVKTHYHNY